MTKMFEYFFNPRRLILGRRETNIHIKHIQTINNHFYFMLLTWINCDQCDIKPFLTTEINIFNVETD